MKRLLLDTHAFLWWCEDSPKLGAGARRAIRSSAVWVSVVSAWELAIKSTIGKITLSMSVEALFRDHVVANGFSLMNIDLSQVTAVQTLKFHHRDPFDRLLASQALQESCDVVSADAVFSRYGLRRVWR